jgi:hypothetical protein
MLDPPSRKFFGDALPPTVQPTEGKAKIPINPAAVIKAIQEEIDKPNSSDLPHTIVKYPR